MRDIYVSFILACLIWTLPSFHYRVQVLQFFSHGEPSHTHWHIHTHTLTRVKLVSAFQRDRALKILFFVTSPPLHRMQGNPINLSTPWMSLLLPGNQKRCILLIDASEFESYKKKKKSQSLHAPLLIRRFAGYYYYINSILLSFLSLDIDLPRWTVQIAYSRGWRRRTNEGSNSNSGISTPLCYY